MAWPGADTEGVAARLRQRLLYLSGTTAMLRETSQNPRGGPCPRARPQRVAPPVAVRGFAAADATPARPCAPRANPMCRKHFATVAMHCEPGAESAMNAHPRRSGERQKSGPGLLAATQIRPQVVPASRNLPQIGGSESRPHTGTVPNVFNHLATFAPGVCWSFTTL